MHALPTAFLLAAGLASAEGHHGPAPPPPAQTAAESGAVRLALAGDLLPSLVSVAAEIELAAPGLVSGGPGVQVVDGRLLVRGSILHPLEGGVRGPVLGVALYRREDAERVLHRITADPLALSDEELRTPLPAPLAVATTAAPLVDEVPPGAPAPIDLEIPTGPVEVAADVPLGFLATVTGYDLVDPSPRDVLRIFEEGGAADHAALARWMAAGGSPWSEADAERKQVAHEALERACTLRGPPRHGDYQRVHAYLSTLERIVGPEETERFLRCRRRIEFLVAGVALSYPEAVRLERRVGVPIEEMERMPSVSNVLGLLDAAARSLRHRAPGKLLALSFDPIDFPNAPRDLRPSPLRREARAVLSPLEPTDVSPLLELVADDPAATRGVFAFYVRMAHEPVVDPLVPWLVEHPEFVADLGRTAARRMPAAMTRRLFAAYADAESRSERQAIAQMMHFIPNGARHLLADELARREGIAVPPDADVDAMLAIYEQAHRARAAHEAERTLEYILHGPDDLVAVPQRIRRVRRLADLSREHVARNADALVAFLARAAWQTAADAPAESAIALDLLERGPWPPRVRKRARLAGAVVQARILARSGETNAALAHLRAVDEHLEDPGVRDLYESLLETEIAARIGQGVPERAAGLLDDYRVRTGRPGAFPELERRIFLARYWPGLVLGGLFGLSLLASLGFLAVRFWRQRVVPYLEARRALRSMMEHADDDLFDDDTRADATFLALETDCASGVSFDGDTPPLLGARASEIDLTQWASAPAPGQDGDPAAGTPVLDPAATGSAPDAGDGASMDGGTAAWGIERCDERGPGPTGEQAGPATEPQPPADADDATAAAPEREGTGGVSASSTLDLGQIDFDDESERSWDDDCDGLEADPSWAADGARTGSGPDEPHPQGDATVPGEAGLGGTGPAQRAGRDAPPPPSEAADFAAFDQAFGDLLAANARAAR